MKLPSKVTITGLFKQAAPIVRDEVTNFAYNFFVKKFLFVNLLVALIFFMAGIGVGLILHP